MTASATRRGLLGAGAAITAAAIGPAVAAVVSADPDAELLELGAQLMARMAAEDRFWRETPEASDEQIAALMLPGSDIVHQIEPVTAKTFEGMRVKALAAWWCSRYGANHDVNKLFPHDTTFERLLVTMFRDLLAGCVPA